MYKDKWSKTKISKIFFLSMCDVNMFFDITSNLYQYIYIEKLTGRDWKKEELGESYRF
jgi:hypothetical protein